MKDKKHIILMFSLVFTCCALLFITLKLLQPESFGEHGNFRWNAMHDIISQEVLNQNDAVCAECHIEISDLHDKDAHYNVPCVDCHGPANLHVIYYSETPGYTNISEDEAKVPKDINLDGCLQCHSKLRARPMDFPQIDRVEHYDFLNVIDNKTKCVECHSPHEPIFLLTAREESKLHPIIHKCGFCHETEPKDDFRKVKDHPPIFECKDCHQAIVESFDNSPHKNAIECTSCHLFHKENDNAGRMYKNGNAKFCLLCHEEKDYKDKEFPPKINWPSHLDSKSAVVNIDRKICLNCHAGAIHSMISKSESSPHPANWEKAHYRFYREEMKGSDLNKSCYTCHKQTYCNACHLVEMPHPRNWDEKHSSIVEAKGEKTCQSCHKEDFCANCH